MPKRKASLSEQALGHDPETVRLQRAYEARIRTLEYKLSQASVKRHQAEDDLHEASLRESALQAAQAIRGDWTVKPMKSRSKKSQATPVICANDWHAEEKVDAESVNGLNKFDLSVCEARLARLWERSVYLIDFFRSVADIRDAVLWAGGDMISGDIHEELAESNQLGPGAAIREKPPAEAGVGIVLLRVQQPDPEPKNLTTDRLEHVPAVEPLPGPGLG